MHKGSRNSRRESKSQALTSAGQVLAEIEDVVSVAVVLPPRRRHATPRYLRARRGQICISITRNPANLRVLMSKAGPTTSRSGGGAASQSYAWRVRFRDRDDSMRSSDSMGGGVGERNPRWRKARSGRANGGEEEPVGAGTRGGLGPGWK